MSAIDLLCVGHAAYDLTAFTDEFPREDSKYETRDLIEGGGGPAANAAYLLAKWSARVAFAGVVGDDLFGARIRDDFASVGADASLLELRAHHATPLSIVLVNRQNGSRTIVNRKLPAGPLHLAGRLPPAWAPRVLLFDGHELTAAEHAMAAYPAAHTILDAGSWREGTAALAGKVRCLAASARFARQATGLSDLETDPARRECLRQMRARFGAETIIVTLGAEGLIYDAGAGFESLPAYPARAVDTTAAGDIFHGALAYGFARSFPLRETLRLASIAAALSVTQPGGRRSIPALTAVEDELNRAAM